MSNRFQSRHSPSNYQCRTMTVALSIAGCLLYMTVLVAGQPEYRAECGVWQNITDTLMAENAVPMNCKKNLQCTGISCTSEFKYNGMLTAGRDFTVDFCFGLVIHPCKEPLQMSFYMENPGEDAEDTYQRTITNGTSFQLQGVHYTVQRIIQADGFVDVTMVEQRYHGYRYVKLGLKYKTRVSTPISTSWPDDLSFQLMPDTLVPVPPCQDSVVTPTHVPGAGCVKYTPPEIGTPIPGSPTWRPPTPDVNCTVGKANSCPINEVCKAPKNNSKAGHCVCTPGYHRDGDRCALHPGSGPEMPEKTCDPKTWSNSCGQHQICQPDVKNKNIGKCKCFFGYDWNGSECGSAPKATEPVRIIGEPDYSKDNGGSSKAKIIIPAAVGGVVLVMAIAAAVVVIKYKRYKARYGQHTLLMSEDDDRDVDDAPMVEA